MRASRSSTVLWGESAATTSRPGVRISPMTGVKSLIGSKLTFWYRLGFAVKLLDVASSVYPSPGERAACSMPILPPAPGLFSTTTACPSRSPRRPAMVRTTTSTPTPGGNGTMILTGRFGQPVSVCACAKGVSSAPRPTAAVRAERRVSVACRWIM